jgi:hypothetical protein
MEASRADMDIGGGRQGDFCISKSPASTIRIREIKEIREIRELAAAYFCAA